MATTKKRKWLPAVIIAAVVLVLVGIMLLLMFMPSSSSELTEIKDTSTKLSLSTDKDGCHQAELKLNSKGELNNNGNGTLLDYVPADIKKISIENESGNYVVKSHTEKTTSTASDGTTSESTDATVYTLVGFEDFAIQVGKPDEIANDAAAVEFTRVTSIKGDNPKEFGLDKPVAVATVYYNDDTSAVITVGADAPGAAGTYITFGDSPTVYLAETSSVDGFSVSVLDLMDLNINDSASDDDTSAFQSIKLSGDNFDDTVTIVQNTNDSTSSASYRLTTPKKEYASESGVSNVEGGIRGLAATAAVCVNPNAAQLKKYGLDTPSATVVAKYSDATVTLYSGKIFTAKNESDTDTEYCYLMTKGGKVVYQIGTDSVKWTTMNYEDLVSQSIVSNKLSALSALTVDTGSKEYAFKLKTTSTTTTNSDGEEEETDITTVKYGSKELDEASFESFYTNLAGLERKEIISDKPDGSLLLTVTYKYTDGRATDVVRYYSTDTQKVLITVNGNTLTYNYKAYVDKIITQVAQVIKDKSVASIL